MGAGKSTTYGYWRSRGDGSEDSFPGLDLLAMPFTFTSSATTRNTIGTMPQGAVPVGAMTYAGSATGGGVPVLNIGTATASNGIANDIPVLTNTAISANTDASSILGTALTSATAITAGSATATGGTQGPYTAKGVVFYHMNDGIL